MAKRRAQPQRSRDRRTKPAAAPGAVVLAFLVGGLAATGAGYLYLHAHTAGETATPERQAVTQPLPSPAPGRASPNRPAQPETEAKSPPFGASEDVFEGGAHVYVAHCASCHGTPTHDAAPPSANSPQLFRESRHRVAAETPAQLYHAISRGAPAEGMPAYAGSLSDTAIWQTTLLLGSADQALPDPVTAILTRRPANPPRR